MNIELKQKWIEALRSGKYKQGTGCLRNKQDEFCCMGVLADILDPTAWKPICNHNFYTFNTRTGSLSNNNIDDDTLILAQDTLIELNDGLYDDMINPTNKINQKSFNEIADWIEINL